LLDIRNPFVRRCPHKGRGLRGIFLLKLEHKSFEVLRHVCRDDIIVQTSQRVPEDEGHLLLGEVQVDLLRQNIRALMLQG
jgi:hypothetical protein